MATYSDLRILAQKLLLLATRWKTPFELYGYSSEIGYFKKTDKIPNMNMRTKYIFLFPKNAYIDIQDVINAYSPKAKFQLSENIDSVQMHENYGRDVYQGVNRLKVFSESSISSRKYDIHQIHDQIDHWLNAQSIRIRSVNPTISDQDLESELQVIQSHFHKAISYLESSNSSNSTLQIRRESGIKHTVQLTSKSGSKRITYSNVLIVFSEDSTLPVFSINAPKARKPRSNSIAAKYATNPSNFKYYDKFGIFEIYEEI